MANGMYAGSRWLTDAELEAMEGFDFGSLTRSLGPIQKQFGAALPGVVQGATTGAAAGPWGALIGGVAGGALSLAQRKGKRPPAPAAAPAPPMAATPPPPAVEPIPAATGAAAPVATSPGAAPTAAGQLAQLLQNPALQQAVSALAAGQGGSGGAVPAGAIMNLLGTLANNAAYEAEALDDEADDSYLRDADGRFLRDPSVPAERAAIVWDRLFQAGGAAGAEPGWGEADWFSSTGIAERQ